MKVGYYQGFFRGNPEASSNCLNAIADFFSFAIFAPFFAIEILCSIILNFQSLSYYYAENAWNSTW